MFQVRTWTWKKRKPLKTASITSSITNIQLLHSVFFSILKIKELCEKAVSYCGILLLISYTEDYNRLVKISKLPAEKGPHAWWVCFFPISILYSSLRILKIKSSVHSSSRYPWRPWCLVLADRKSMEDCENHYGSFMRTKLLRKIISRLLFGISKTLFAF